jgi:hypothetical protein
MITYLSRVLSSIPYKQLSLCALVIFAIQTNCYSQYNKLKGSSSAQVGVGFHDAGLLISAYSLKTFDQKIKAGFGGAFLFGKVADVSYKAICLDGIGTYSLRSTRFFSLNGVAGLTFIGDFMNDFESEKFKKNFSLNYGVLGGAEGEFIATRKLSFVLGGTYRYYLRKDFGNLRYHLSASIRVTL